MDLNFLIDKILPQRKKEIEEGLNLSTRQPIYVVLDLQENIMSGHSDFSPVTNLKGIESEHGYIDLSLDSEDVEFCITSNEMDRPEEVTRFYTDNIIAFFLTSKGANDYLKYQTHNLTNAYVFVFHSGYRNIEMDTLLKGE